MCAIDCAYCQRVCRREALARWSAFGGRHLSTCERCIFVIACAAAVVINALFLNYSIQKVRSAAANPTSNISVRTATAFPSFVVFGTFPPRCSATVSCQLYEQVNATTESAPLPLAASGILCDTNSAPNQFSVTVPSAVWKPGPAPALGPNARSGVGLALWTLIETQNWTSADADCYLDVWVQSLDDWNNSPPSIGDTIAAPNAFAVPAAVGMETDVGLKANADEYVDAPAPVYHLTSAFIRSISSASNFPNRIALVFGSFAPWTNFDIAWNQRVVNYSWTDAAAAVFAVVNVTVSAIAVLFPLTAMAPHRRLFVFTRHAVCASELPELVERDDRRDGDDDRLAHASPTPLSMPLNAQRLDDSKV